MKLPLADRAIVPSEKITQYLLSRLHPVGRHKAAFFTAVGYCLEGWEEFADDLVQHAIHNEVSTMEETRFGVRFAIEGILQSPKGPRMIRSVWFIEDGEELPRLVTAYPLE